jgi:hypothetical protein
LEKAMTETHRILLKNMPVIGQTEESMPIHRLEDGVSVPWLRRC